jgi:dihydroflavonol-4-reductase
VRLLVTGGTGFVGSHTVAAVTRAGHTVRLMVRRQQRAGAALAPLRISVQAAVAGCDAMIHIEGPI